MNDSKKTDLTEIKNDAPVITKEQAQKDKVKEVMNSVKKTDSLAKLNSTSIGMVFEQYKIQIAQALPRHLTADRMIQMAVTLISKNPKLKECSASSLIGAVMQASILGFRPVEALAQCYFVPYSNKKRDAEGKETWVKEVQFQIGNRGLIDLARRSGQIQSIHAFGVYKGDDFKYALGLNPSIHHIPSENEKEAKNLTHAYAVVHYKDGGYNFTVLTRKEIEALRRRNSMQKEEVAGAWKTDYEAMACAKVIKQLSKYMPLSDEMSNAIRADEGIIDPSKFANDRSGELVDVETPEYEDFEEVNPETK